MFQVTRAAAARLLAVRSGRKLPRDFGVRLRGSPGNADFSVGFVPEPRGDEVVASHLGISFYMTERLAGLLSGWTLDLRPVDGHLGLVLVRQEGVHPEEPGATNGKAAVPGALEA